MKLKLREILEHGHEKERIVIDVIENANLKFYMIFDTTYSKQHYISNKLRHPYWFPEIEVTEDDVIILYTKKGKYSWKKRIDGATTHFFYWGLDSNVWNDDGDAAILFEIDGWESLKAHP